GEREHEALERVERVRERTADLRRLALDVGGEQRPRDDREGQPRHLLVGVQLGPVAPAGERTLRGRDHLLGVASDLAAVEERLDEPALAQVELALARQQALAEDALRLL